MERLGLSRQIEVLAQRSQVEKSNSANLGFLNLSYKFSNYVISNY